jgi:tetratricopeptide (TPR) repeat protein
MAKGDVEGAKKSFQQAVDLEPKLTEARVALSTLTKGQPDAAVLASRITELKSAVDKDPGNVAVRNELAGAYALNKQTKEAEVEYKQILTIAPTFVPANMGLALIRLEEKKYDDSADFLKAVVRTQPNHLRANALLSNYYLSKGNRELALQHVETVYRANPNDLSVKVRLAELYSAVGRTKDAVARIDEAVKASPKSAGLRLVAGRLLLADGAVNRAIDELTTATQLQPKLQPAYFLLGMAYERAKNPDRASQAYERAQTLAPNDPAPPNNLAYLYAVQNKNLNEALKSAQRAAELAPSAPSIQDTLGFVHYRRGEYDKAEPLLRKAAEQLRNNASVQYHLGMTYYRLGRKEDAALALRRSLQLDEKLAEAPEIRQVLKELGA